MIKNFKDSLGRLFNLNNLYSFFLVGILFGVQLFYRDIPGAMLISMLVATGAIFISTMKVKILVKALGIYAIIAILFLVYLFIPNRYFSVAIFNIAVLWAVLTGLKYVTHEPYTEMLKLKIIRGLIALVYFIIVYLSIFIIVQLLNSLFSLDIIYDSWPFRLSNALSFSLGLLVLMYEKEELIGNHSGFFKAIVGKILPILTLAMAGLSIALLVRYYFSGDIPGYMDAYYGIFGLVFLAYVLSEVSGTPKSLRIIVGLSMAVSILGYSLYIWKNSGFFANYGIAINVIVASWLLYHVVKGAVADKNLSNMSLIIAMIILLPPFGYNIYRDYRTLDNIFVPGDSIYEQFKQGYTVDQGGDTQSISIFYGPAMSQYVTLNISEYNYVIKEINLNGNDSVVNAAEFSMSISPDFKTLKIVNAARNIDDEIPIMDLMKSIYKESPPYYRITEDAYMIDLINYSYYEYYDGNRPKEISSYVTFDLYYK